MEGVSRMAYIPKILINYTVRVPLEYYKNKNFLLLGNVGSHIGYHNLLHKIPNIFVGPIYHRYYDSSSTFLFRKSFDNIYNAAMETLIHIAYIRGVVNDTIY